MVTLAATITAIARTVVPGAFALTASGTGERHGGPTQRQHGENDEGGPDAMHG
jgi:hypothetical protein